MEKEIQSALLPLMGIIAIVPILGAVLSFLMAHWIVRPISRLTEVAERITKGDLQNIWGIAKISRRDWRLGPFSRTDASQP